MGPPREPVSVETILATCSVGIHLAYRAIECVFILLTMGSLPNDASVAPNAALWMA